MTIKAKLLFFITLMLLLLGVATMINVSLNMREYSIKNATEKATMTAEIVKDGLTAHMVNHIMEKRQYFLNQISNNNTKIKKLWLVRSPNVIKQYGEGLNSEIVRDEMDKQVLSSGKIIKKITETPEETILRISVPYNATVSSSINCLSCHDVQAGETLGAVSMEFDISSMRSAGIYTILKILAINIFFIIVALFLVNYYVSPYIILFEDMKQGIKKAYRGDFTHKFKTDIVQEIPREIVQQLNTLFGKMQDTFGNIKYNLSTFIPQGCVSSADPLQEAKSIIGELSDIYKFKKTIELDPSKEIVYERFIQVLEGKYKLTNFSFYEINSTKDSMQLIYKTDEQADCNLKEIQEIKPAHLCRAFRTKSEVISSDFKNLCQECDNYSQEYICIPFTINEEFSLALNIHAKDTAELSKINSYVASIKNYLEAAKPVIESKLLTNKLRESSLKDPMTGLYNRRFLEEFIETFANQVKRENESYTIMMLDVDFFKMVNDTYGHDVGDKVIVKIGKILLENIRESDLAVRYGGEEFLVMLHNASEEGAMRVAKNIHTAFGETVFQINDQESMQKTLSIGISLFPQDGDTIWKCIKLADTALYVAKTTGRNKIVRYSDEINKNKELR
jgi:diguanylate cyclase (GGDEF)-like protein